MKKLIITLHKDGTQKIEVIGATGAECVEFTRKFEARLGNPIGERQLKPEYDMGDSEVEGQRETES